MLSLYCYNTLPRVKLLRDEQYIRLMSIFENGAADQVSLPEKGANGGTW